MSQALSTPDFKLHDSQQEVLDSDAGTRVVIKGRQWGGTTLVAADTIEYAHDHPDSLAWAAAPSRDQARIIWRRICSMLDQHEGDRARLTVTLPNGARIKCLSVGRVSVGCGQSPDYLAIDEADMIDEERWKDSAFAASLQNVQHRLFVTTPFGYAEETDEYPGSWVYDHFLDGFKVGTDTESWRFTTDSAPHTESEYVDENRARLDPNVAEQELDARWESE